MGYTHYWGFRTPAKGKAEETEKAYQKAIKECQKIAQSYHLAQPKGSCTRLSGYTAYSKTYGGLHINGARDMAHEDFCMREHFNQNKSGFCKTARKPYDIVVTACLIVLKTALTLPAMVTQSNGMMGLI